MLHSAIDASKLAHITSCSWYAHCTIRLVPLQIHTIVWALAKLVHWTPHFGTSCHFTLAIHVINLFCTLVALYTLHRSVAHFTQIVPIYRATPRAGLHLATLHTSTCFYGSFYFRLMTNVLDLALCCDDADWRVHFGVWQWQFSLIAH